MPNIAASLRAKVQAKYADTVVSARGHRSLEMYSPSTKIHSVDVSIGALHYGVSKDQEINTDWKSSIAPWQHEMVEAGFNLHAISDFDDGQVIEYKEPDSGDYVRFQPQPLQYSNDLDQIQQIEIPQSVSASIVDDDTLFWEDAYGSGLDFSWQAQSERLRKLLTIGALSDLPAMEQYIIDGGNPVLALNMIFDYSSGVTPYIDGVEWDKSDKDTQGRVEFRDSGDNVLWWFGLPKSWDSDLTQQLGTLRFKKQGNSLYITHLVPMDFITNAVFPVMVDVDVDEQVGASTDDVDEYGDYGIYLNNIVTFVGAVGSGGDPSGAGYRFQTVNVPNTPTLVTAYITLTAFGLGGTATDVMSEVTAEAIDDAPTFSDSPGEWVWDRTPVGTSVAWNPTAWVADVEYDSPEIKTVVDDVFNRGGWAANQDLVILHLDTGSETNAYIKSDTWDHNQATCAQLHIEYEALPSTGLISYRAVARGIMRGAARGIG